MYDSRALRADPFATLILLWCTYQPSMILALLASLLVGGAAVLAVVAWTSLCLVYVLVSNL